MPTPREHLSTSAVNGKIYAIGGESLPTAGEPMSTVEEYDTELVGVEAKGKLPTKCGEIK